MGKQLSGQHHYGKVPLQYVTRFLYSCRKLKEFLIILFKEKKPLTQLLTLIQVSQSVVNYAIEFRILAAESGWNKSALPEGFRCGLNEEIKDEVSARIKTDSLEALISLSVCLDKRLTERRREKAGRIKRFPSNSLPSELAIASPASHSVPQPVSSASTSGGSDEPMQLRRARLTPAEE